jgi:nucleotide-binding universal stress UspA family protein
MALELAERHQAHVEGLEIVNSAWLRRAEPVPLGMVSFKVALDEKHVQNARERAAAAVRDFRVQAENAAVTSFAVHDAEGAPLEVVQREAIVHDLIVLGRDSMFDIEGELYELPLCVERIIRGAARPVLLVPTQSRYFADEPHSPVLVAFDGSAAASRTLHMFALLGLALGRAAHVVTVNNSSPELAQRTAEQACELLQRHGVITTHPIGLGDEEAGSPGEMILGLSKSLGVGMIVMGAYGRSGVREIFGSCTRTVLRACPTTLFLHH